MPTEIGWEVIGIRLALAVVAGGLIGLDRGSHGRPAGLRTTLLVCLAAAISMVQVNLLLSTGGKLDDSFGTLDLMRLPLGILTGMGFIGAGAIVRQGDTVRGVTTASTLWFVTVVGLCFGGGQLGLGAVGLGLGMVVLKYLKAVEARLPQDRRAKLWVTYEAGASASDALRKDLIASGCRVVTSGVQFDKGEGCWTFECEVQWRAQADEGMAPAFLATIAQRSDVARLKWQAGGNQS